ncbi:hypothetical protein DICVIV_12308 [Dictyocaulus viviparus]|uniref:Uncharacterized protein n=1 Tax=Dictyocaulus viviparus TaxID=29172 RepID=A0A0D8XDJ4_DICVI|nr:hypothetical protein DICVIV_12308 [Dictyocaulus viviparus]
MPEDPDISKRRIEQQQLRKQLHEVFGPFEQFCEYVAGATNAGSSGIMRHGVVQISMTDSDDFGGAINAICFACFCLKHHSHYPAVYATTFTNVIKTRQKIAGLAKNAGVSSRI